MKKGEINYLVFFISAVLFASLIASIKYLTNQEFGIFGTIVAFLFGGFVGLIGSTQHTSFLKNATFGTVIFFLLWVVFTPIATIGNSIIIKRVEFWTLIFIGIMFVNREAWNVVARFRKKKQHLGLTFVGTVLFLIWLNISGVNSTLAHFLNRYWYVSLGVLLIWMVVLYFFVSRRLEKASRRIIRQFK